MSAFFDWLSKNPTATNILIWSFVILVISVAIIYLVAFFQGREISFWPPKIGQKPGSKNSILTAKEPQNGLDVLQVHRYSGEWEVENRFSRWKDYELGVHDTVYFHGKAFLLLSVDGKKGFGTQIGKLHISIGNYKATYENTNRINRANVTENGTLHLYVEVLSRIHIEEEGEPSEARFREGLFGSGEFELELYPVPGASNRLKGKHIYKVGNKVYQAAEEDYKYLGL